MNVETATDARLKKRAKPRNYSRFKDDAQLYLMSVPAVLQLFLFAYLPMAGLVIAFKDFDFSKGIFGSDWLHPIYYNFLILFNNNPDAFVAIRNTLFLNALFISVGTVFALALALMFNEIKNKAFQRITQSVTFLPYFISTVVIGVFVSGLFSFNSGTINHLLMLFGFEKMNFYEQPAYWPGILLAVAIWRGAGYSAIVYLAAITGIDTSFYEAAEIDGATRWQQTRYISLPMIMPTVIILTLLAVGRIMNADFGFFYNIVGDTPMIFPSTDVLDTYIYRALRRTGDIGISSATGFFQSVVSFALVLVCNKLARNYEKEAALF